MAEIIEWFEKLIIDWQKIIEINKKISKHEELSDKELKITFPFVPFEMDCYTLFNLFTALIPKLFTENGDLLILILNDTRDKILWSAAQYEENGNYLDFKKIEFIDSKEILRLIRQNKIKDVHNNIQKLKCGLNPNFNLNSIILIDIYFLEQYKSVHKKMEIEFLDHIANFWRFLAKMYESGRIEILNEPLFFNFLRKFLTDNKNFDASEFKNIITKLLPPQNVVFYLFNDENEEKTVAFAILTTPYRSVFTFLDKKEIQEVLKKIKKKKSSQGEIMVNFAKRLHKNYRVFYNEKFLKVSAAFVLKFEILDYLRDILKNYNFKHALVKFAEYIKNSDKLWTSDGKIVLFRRWGSTFLDFDVEKLDPSSITNINSGVRFIYGYKARTLIFIFDQDVNLLSIFGLKLKNGSLEKFYNISTDKVIDIFIKEKNVENALKIAKNTLSEELGCWINHVIGVRYTDLNKFSAILSMGTSINGALKFLKMLDNFFRYEMLIYPIEPFLDLFKKEGSIKTIKRLFFPIMMQD
ncbi:MAG: hypothetical protein ACTSRG_08105 [Candidatus Helarchaeota archaeon]